MVEAKALVVLTVAKIILFAGKSEYFKVVKCLCNLQGLQFLTRLNSFVYLILRTPLTIN